MEKKLKKKKLIYTILIVLFSVLVVVQALNVAGIAIENEEKTNDSSIRLYDATDENQQCSTSAAYMSNYFAQYDTNENIQLYFVMDKDFTPCIVAMDSRKLGDLQDIIDYTYGTSQETPPDAIDVSGHSKLIDETIKSLAVDSFNQFWGSDVITVDNFSDYFGDYYIDTTYNTSVDRTYLQTNIYVLAAFIILLALMIYLKIKTKKQADKMVQASAETGEGVKWTDPCRLQAEGEVNTIGAQTSYMEEAIENVPLGILGALVGAVIGGILWVIVGRMGYIAGICGFAVILLAMKGYKLLGKKLSRKAMVLIIIISLAVLFAANYVSYTWTLVDAINKNETGKGDFATVFKNLPDLLKAYDSWGRFMGDYAIGILLTIVASFTSIMAEFKKR